jgi:hypothetical protein
MYGDSSTAATTKGFARVPQHRVQRLVVAGLCKRPRFARARCTRWRVDRRETLPRSTAEMQPLERVCIPAHGVTRDAVSAGARSPGLREHRRGTGAPST